MRIGEPNPHVVQESSYSEFHERGTDLFTITFPGPSHLPVQHLLHKKELSEYV